MTVAEIVARTRPRRRACRSTAGWCPAARAPGVQPGFRMTDPTGQLYQIEVDPPSNPELASGAEIIGTAFYHAIGYNAVDVYLAELDRDDAGDRGEGDDSRSAERQAPRG